MINIDVPTWYLTSSQAAAARSPDQGPMISAQSSERVVSDLETVHY